MPLLGMVDPAHAERHDDEPGRLPLWLPIEAVLEHAKTASPKWSPWTYELVKAASDEWQDRDYVSTTMLTGGCARSKVIERKEEFIIELDSMYASLRGTQIHRTLEHTARPGAVAEGRFFTNVTARGQKVEVSCSPDIVHPPALGDYKVTESPPNFAHPWKNHKWQVNMNRYIVNNATRWDLPEGVELPWDPRRVEFENLYLVYLGPKGPKVIECTKSVPVTFKNGGTGKKWLPYVMSDDEVYDYMVPRLDAMLLALESYPEWPFPDDEEFVMSDISEGGLTGFEGPPGWACPGYPWCKLPNCLAKRWPHGLRWKNPEKKARRARG